MPPPPPFPFYEEKEKNDISDFTIFWISDLFPSGFSRNSLHAEYVCVVCVCVERVVVAREKIERARSE